MSSRLLSFSYHSLCMMVFFSGSAACIFPGRSSYKLMITHNINYYYTNSSSDFIETEPYQNEIVLNQRERERVIY